MTIRLFSLLLALLPMLIAHADESTAYRIQVRVEGDPATRYQLVFGDSQTQTIEIKNDLSIEVVFVQGGTSVLRLQRPSTSDVLHIARQSESLGLSRSAGYAVCGDKVLFVSPLDDELPNCAS